MVGSDMKERVLGRQGSLYFLSLFCCREGPLAANRELSLLHQKHVDLL